MAQITIIPSVKLDKEGVVFGIYTVDYLYHISY